LVLAVRVRAVLVRVVLGSRVTTSRVASSGVATVGLTESHVGQAASIIVIGVDGIAALVHTDANAGAITTARNRAGRLIIVLIDDLTLILVAVVILVIVVVVAANDHAAASTAVSLRADGSDDAADQTDREHERRERSEQALHSRLPPNPLLWGILLLTKTRTASGLRRSHPSEHSANT